MYTIDRYTLLSRHYAHSMDEISSMILALYRVVMINKQYVHEVYTLWKIHEDILVICLQSSCHILTPKSTVWQPP